MQATKILALIGASLLVLSCATTPSEPERPDWVDSPPLSDDDSEIFVVSGSSQTGDVAEAEETASLNLINEINRALGVEITAESNAEAIATQDEFEATVRQQVRQSGSGRITGLRIEDRYVDRQDGRVTVYLFGAYDRAAFLEEQRKREELQQEKIDAVAIPEQQGRSAEDEGRFFDALGRFIEAAMAASNSDIRNAEIYFEENINNARRVVSRFRLEKETDNLSGVVGRPFEEDFVARLTYDGPSGRRPVPNATLVASYPILRSNGRTGIQTAQVSTDQDGIARFDHPVPQTVGRETVTLSLDLSSYLRPLDDVGRAFRSYVDGLMDAVASTRARFEYETISLAREIPTGVVVLDLGLESNPRSSETGGAAVLAAMSDGGFRTRRLLVAAEDLQALDDQAVIDAGAEAGVQRVAFGVFRVEEVVDENNRISVRVSGEMKVIDVETGDLLYSDSLIKNGIGSALPSAVNDTLRALGRDFGNDLVRSLR